MYNCGAFFMPSKSVINTTFKYATLRRLFSYYRTAIIRNSEIFFLSLLYRESFTKKTVSMPRVTNRT